ncbi:hypothetical protein SAMN02745126_06525 [Enhydrobacter aerosaccus]|uniref:Glycosyl hydrolase n=2 Tax=Enhydrobacter aerosaccus TaxID=225324 RepID=A0A1T4TMZ6_9HYPH|nr:hypothetical protein SAMN02745126_06525 [Enhydrobacter aerosaccus]
MSASADTETGFFENMNAGEFGMRGTILVGTASQGILRSVDDGATWHRLGLKEAIEFDGVVRSVVVHPQDPSIVLAGADGGLCISKDGGAHFSLIDSPMNGQTVWSIAIDPANPSYIYAGTGAPSRAALFRSKDDGKSWERLSPEIPEFCQGVNRPRILTICIDPVDTAQVWFGVEEGGAWRSFDHGDSWTRIDQDGGITNSDIHAIAILPPVEDKPGVAFVLTVNSVFTSTDGGRAWTGVPSRPRFDGMYYTRTVQPLPDSDVLMLAIGDGTPGTRSKLYRSVDRGVTWSASLLHSMPNSTFWAFGMHPADPQLLFAGTKYGDLFRSLDGGVSWFKEWRSFPEITAIAWTPFEAPVKAHPQSIA